MAAIEHDATRRTMTSATARPPERQSTSCSGNRSPDRPNAWQSLRQALGFRWRTPRLTDADVSRAARRQDLRDRKAKADAGLTALFVLLARHQRGEALERLRALLDDVARLALAIYERDAHVGADRLISELRSLPDEPLVALFEQRSLATLLDRSCRDDDVDVDRIALTVDSILRRLDGTLDRLCKTTLYTPLDAFRATAIRQVCLVAGALAVIGIAGIAARQSYLHVHNLALDQPAAQSTTIEAGAAERAVDGVVDGNFLHGSVTQTAAELHAWWQVDLGESARIRSIEIWNRTDCCRERLSRLYVMVSIAPFRSANLATTLTQEGVSSYYFARLFPIFDDQVEIPIDRRGRYVRIQLAGASSLSLAEVRVWEAVGPLVGAD